MLRYEVANEQRTEIVQDEQAQCLLPMELRLLRETQVLHWRSERVEVPLVKVCMELESKGCFHVVLRLEMHLNHKVHVVNVYGESEVERLR